jgi:hypothetical protein
VARAQDRQQVVDDVADLGHVDLQVHVSGGAEREHDVLRLGGVLDPLREPQGEPLEQLLGARLLEGHAARLDGVDRRALSLDGNHLEAAVGEGERERQADAAQADYGDGARHAPESTDGDAAR